jgi:hypothetical protein
MLSKDVTKDNKIAVKVSHEKPQEVSVQVEHLDDENDVVQDAQVTEEVVEELLADTNSSEQPLAVRRTRRNIVKPNRFIEEYGFVAYALSVAEEIEGNEPSTYTEATIAVDRNNWMAAMQDEMQSLEKNGTWDLVKLPKEKKTVRCKWIFKRKEGVSPSEPPRYKARLVAKGFSQIPGVDYCRRRYVGNGVK